MLDVNIKDCVKCGGDECYLSYNRDLDMIDVECNYCGYTWLEYTMDHQIRKEEKKNG